MMYVIYNETVIYYADKYIPFQILYVNSFLKLFCKIRQIMT